MPKHPKRPRDPNQPLAASSITRSSLSNMDRRWSLRARYSPAQCVGAERRRFIGTPDQNNIGTSFVERQNLTMRMHTRRFPRLTNAFSKKAENHAYAVALHSMAYNFVRIHKTLKCSPAMATGVTDRLWDIVDVVRVIEEWEAKRLVEG